MNMEIMAKTMHNVDPYKKIHFLLDKNNEQVQQKHRTKMKNRGDF